MANDFIKKLTGVFKLKGNENWFEGEAYFVVKSTSSNFIIISITCNNT